MNRSLGAVIALALVVGVLVYLSTSNDREPSGQPSPVPSPTVVSSAQSGSPPPSPSPSPVASADVTAPAPTTSPQLSAVPVRTPPGGVTEGGSGATDLRSSAFCDPASPATGAMALTWRSAGSGEQLVAISTRPDGFETGGYTVSENLPAAQEQYAVSPVEPGGVYYWRVLTGSGPGWIASEIATFTGPTCVVDAS